MVSYRLGSLGWLGCRGLRPLGLLRGLCIPQRSTLVSKPISDHITFHPRLRFILCTHGRSYVKIIKCKVHQFCCDTCFKSSLLGAGDFQNISSVVSCGWRVVFVSIFNNLCKPTIFPKLPEIPLTATLSKARWTHLQGWTGLGGECIHYLIQGGSKSPEIVPLPLFRGRLPSDPQKASMGTLPSRCSLGGVSARRRTRD